MKELRQPWYLCWLAKSYIEDGWKCFEIRARRAGEHHSKYYWQQSLYHCHLHQISICQMQIILQIKFQIIKIDIHQHWHLHVIRKRTSILIIMIIVVVTISNILTVAIFISIPSQNWFVSTSLNRCNCNTLSVYTSTCATFNPFHLHLQIAK